MFICAEMYTIYYMEVTNKTEMQMNTTTFGGHMVDFTFLPSDFNSTEITVVANSNDAKQYLAERYGFGCVSLNVRKSAAPDLADSFEFQGLSYN